MGSSVDVGQLATGVALFAGAWIEAYIPSGSSWGSDISMSSPESGGCSEVIRVAVGVSCWVWAALGGGGGAE